MKCKELPIYFYERANSPDVQKHEMKSQGDGSAIKDACNPKLKACWPELDLWSTDKVESRQLNPPSFLLTFTCEPWHTCLPPHTSCY